MILPWLPLGLAEVADICLGVEEVAGRREEVNAARSSSHYSPPPLGR